MSLTEIFESEEFKRAMEAEAADRKFYDPAIWRQEYMGIFHYRPFQIEFDCDEIKMIREMEAKTGYPRSEIIREAVRYLYSDIIRGG